MVEGLFAEHITISYRLAGPEPIVHDLSLSVSSGSILHLQGSSGTGKSSVLRVLAGLQRPDAGRVCIDGDDIYALSSRQKARLRAGRIASLAQDPRLVPEFDVATNVALPALIAGAGRRRARQQATGLLEQLGVGHRAKHRSWEVSGGELQRVGLARALIVRPRWLFLDEPFTDLDANNIALVAGLIRAQVDDGAAVVVASHVELPPMLDAKGVVVGMLRQRDEARQWA